jgi:hypothetical protein
VGLRLPLLAWDPIVRTTPVFGVSSGLMAIVADREARRRQDPPAEGAARLGGSE